MKIVRLLILDKEDVKERLAQLGADVPEGLTADKLGNLYSEWLEKLPADVDLVVVYVGGNQMNIIANDDAVWELPDNTRFGKTPWNCGLPEGLTGDKVNAPWWPTNRPYASRNAISSLLLGSQATGRG